MQIVANCRRTADLETIEKCQSRWPLTGVGSGMNIGPDAIPDIESAILPSRYPFEHM